MHWTASWLLLSCVYWHSPGVAFSPAEPDPDSRRSICGIVQAHGYMCNPISADTTDDWTISLFHIPATTTSFDRKAPVILQHGLMDTCFSFILNEPSDSLAYLLADSGYDVYLSNSRGTRYTNHTGLTRTDSAFWDFSWDEMAQYDVPAIIAKVSEHSGENSVAYVGHSQGTTIGFAALSEGFVPAVTRSMRKPDNGAAAGIGTFVGLGPVATLGGCTNSMLDALATIKGDEGIAIIQRLFNHGEFTPDTTTLDALSRLFCPICSSCCASAVEIGTELFCGPTHMPFNQSRLSVAATHEPGATSVQNILHYGQAQRSNKFQHFDFGKDKNLKKYGQTSPPEYLLSRIPKSLNFTIIGGLKDELADPNDVAQLVSGLRRGRDVSNAGVEFWLQPGYAHLDYLWSTSAVGDIYPQVIATLDKWAKPR